MNKELKINTIGGVIGVAGLTVVVINSNVWVGLGIFLMLWGNNIQRSLKND